MADTRRPARPRRKISPATLDLPRRAQNDGRDAFARLYAEHLDLTTRYVAVRLRDRGGDAILDLVPDAFADALTELAYAPQDVTGWFLQLAARACTRHRGAARFLHAAHETHDLAAIDPRDLAAAVVGRSTQAIRDLELRGLRRLNAALAREAAGATAVAR